MAKHIIGTRVFSLVAVIVTLGAAPAGADVSIGLSDAAGVEVFGNYLTLAFSILSPRVELRAGAMEASVGWRAITSPSPVPGTGGWRLDAEIAVAPAFGTYTPAIGLGYLYVRLAPAERYPDPDASTLYFVLAPLRFGFPFAPGVQFLVSALELRYGPLFPVDAPLNENQGAFHLDACIVRLGVRIPLSRDG